VTFIAAFAATGYVYCFLHPSDVAFGAQTGTLGLIIGALKWISVHDQKVPDA
jgi:hypothetical protein